MANTKEYKIVINGLQESISAVESLNKQLDNLEKRMNAVNATKVSTGGGSSRSGGGNNSALTQEQATQKEINKLKQEGMKLDAKIEAAQNEIYKRVDATKQLYKEVVSDQKAIAAQERLTADAYSNTMVGMKQKLADLKAVIQTTDLSDDDAIKKMTADANELTNKLKELEEAYGQFGRNVGNYKSAFEGLDKITVTIGGVTKEFNNLNQASKALKSAMGVLIDQNKEDTTEYKKLEKELERVTKAQQRLNSAMNDAKASSRAMDDILDTFESIGALGQVTQGFSTLFGIDDAEMEKQIAKLVALQNALKGIEKIRKQMNTGEGIGGWFSKGSKAIDQFVAKLAGAEVRMGKIIGSSKQASIALNGVSTVLKGLATGGVAVALPFLLDFFNSFVTKIKEMTFGTLSAADAAEIFGKKAELMAKSAKDVEKSRLKEYLKGVITQEEYMIDKTQILSNVIRYLIDDMANVRDVDFTHLTKGTPFSGISVGYSTNGFDPNSNDENERLKARIEAYKNALDYFNELGKKMVELEEDADRSMIPLFKKLTNGATEVTKDFEQLGKALTSNLLADMKDVLDKYTEAQRKARQEIQENGSVSEETRNKIDSYKQTILSLKKALDDPNMGPLFDNIDKFSKSGQYYARQINVVREALEGLSDSMSTANLDPNRLLQLQIDGMKDSEEKIRKQNELNRKKELAEVGFDPEYKKAVEAKYDRELQESLKAYRKTKKQEADEKKREARDIQREIDDYELQLMREGLAKQMKALKNERDNKIQDIIDSGIRVAERTGLAEAVYDKKLLELKRDWAYEMEEVYRNMYKEIEDINRDAMQREVRNAEQSITNKQSSDKSGLWRDVIDIDYPNNLSRRNEYYEKVLKIDLEASKKQQEIRQESLDKELEFNKKEEELRHERIVDAQTEKDVLSEISKIPEPTDADYAAIEQKLQEQLSKMRGELVDQYNAGKLSFKDFVDFIENEQDAHNAKMNSLQNEYNVQTEQNVQEGLEETKQLYNNYYQELLSSIRTMQDDVSRVMSQQPVTDTAGWGVVNVKKTKQNYNFSEDAYKNIAADIKRTKEMLKKDLKADKITAEDFFMRNSELDAMQKSVDDALKGIKDKQSMLVADFVQSIQKYVQAVADSFNQIMSAVWDAQDNGFDKEQDEIDKMNDELDKKLDKQQQIVEDHKNAIESIEDELAKARGSRRQHLIDQLNAEMAAQREAAAQEKKIQQQKEAQQKKQDELDKKRKKAQYQRDMMQAVVNGAMAVTYAAVNAWPIPAIPMMALAAATTAAQLAIMSSNKPYAKGGQLDGPSHREGGIKVPGIGGGIELEGQEYVIRKKTTNKNVDLLDYINKSEKKLTLDDFIDFYGTKARRTIKSISPKGKYADGGMIPTLSSNNIDINDKLISALEAYNERDVVVSVVDINNRQNQVKNVQVLAGLTD